jgi:hypothetical protein
MSKSSIFITFRGREGILSLKFSLKHSCLSTFFARQPKARRCHRQPLDRGHNHHYYCFFAAIGASLASVEAVEAGLTAAEAAASSMPVVFSLRTSSSSDSLRTMILQSPGDPRAAWLSSPKSLWVNSKSQKVVAMRSSSSEDEDRLITRTFPESPSPGSNTGEQGWREEISDEILVAVETQITPVEESWCHWVKDFPLQRENMNA